MDEFWNEMLRQATIFGKQVNEGSIRHYQATVNEQISRIVNNPNQEVLDASLTSRGAQPPIMTTTP